MICTIAREGMQEMMVTRTGLAASGLAAVAAELQRDCGAQVLAAECFGPGCDNASPAIPMTWVRDRGAAGPGLGGAHLWAVADIAARPLVLDGQVVGTVVEGPHAIECTLAGLHAADVAAPREVQARATFELIEQALALVGMDFSHVARTWLFIDDILSWYAEFNRARDEFFAERGVYDQVVPASTGIGGGNAFGAALVAGAYAVKAARPAAVTVEAIPSPLQCPALQYGSSFSRAVEVTMPDVRRLLVSGTASIAPEGHTQHLGDVRAQTARTCEVIAAILESRGMDWTDVTRATAYVRHAEDAGVFASYWAETGQPDLPVIVAHNVICRDDLLFELEVDAVQPA